MIHGRKIFIFVSMLTGGGAERVTYTLSLGLQKIGYDITVIALNSNGVRSEEYKTNLKVIDLKIPEEPSWLMRPRALRAIMSLFKTNMPDVIFCSHIPTLAFVVLFAAKLSKIHIPIYHIEHNTFSGALKERYGRSFFYNWFRKVTIKMFSKLVYPRLTKIIAVSEGVKKDLMRYKLVPSDNIVQIYNPVVSQELLDIHVVKGASEKLILGCGRLEPRKGFDVLLKAFAKVVATNHAVHLIIIGEGALRQELENLIRTLKIVDKVSLPGYQEDPFTLYLQADVFVLSSREEGLPTVLIEAMTCGATPVSTDCPSGPNEILEGGKYGYLVPVDDIEKMAEAINKAIEEPINPEILKQRASYFSVDNAICSYSALIEGTFSSSTS